MKRDATNNLLGSIVKHAALISLSIVFLIPFVWLVTTSLKSETHLFAFPPEWLPRAEYLELDDGDWAEVVRQEHVEFAPIEYDAAGNPKERQPTRTKVRLVDSVGDPLTQPLFTVQGPVDRNALDQGVLLDELQAGFAENQHRLPSDPILRPMQYGKRWIIEGAESHFIIDAAPKGLTVSTDTPSRRLVDTKDIVTKARPTFRHYVKGVQGFQFDLFLQNTLFIALFAVVGTVLSSSWVAFGFSILQWPGRDKVFYLMLATLMLPPQVTMIPLFIIFKWLGWINTYAPLLVPAFLGNAFFIFLLRQFFRTIPEDLIDAARFDGCSTLRIYWQIVMPLSIPALATVALFTFMGSWNDFMGPLIYVVDEAKYTLSLGLAMFKGRFATRYGEMMAVSVLLTLPIIVLFFCTQKTFIQGIKTSGMKG